MVPIRTTSSSRCSASAARDQGLAVPAAFGFARHVPLQGPGPDYPRERRARKETRVPISPDLLQILCCPSSKTPLELLAASKVDRLNAAIEAGTVHYADGSAVEKPLEEGLVTRDGLTVYRIDDSIPVMLVDQAIPTSQLQDW